MLHVFPASTNPSYGQLSPFTVGTIRTLWYFRAHTYTCTQLIFLMPQTEKLILHFKLKVWITMLSFPSPVLIIICTLTKLGPDALNLYIIWFDPEALKLSIRRYNTGQRIKSQRQGKRILNHWANAIETLCGAVPWYLHRSAHDLSHHCFGKWLGTLSTKLDNLSAEGV